MPFRRLRLPLWRECAKEMIEKGVKHGDVFPSSYFETLLRCSPDTMQFSLGIAEIRRVLEQRGLYLSGRGQKGEQFVVLPAEANVDVMACYARKATDALKRGVILGTNTRLDLLGSEDRRRHEAMLEKMAIKFALMSRSGQVAKALPKRRRELLQKTA